MIRDITIQPVANGYFIQFGCQRLAYTSTKKLIADLKDYLEDPEKTEQRIKKEDCFNIEHTLSGIQNGCNMPPPCQGTEAVIPARLR